MAKTAFLRRTESGEWVIVVDGTTQRVPITGGAATTSHFTPTKALARCSDIVGVALPSPGEAERLQKTNVALQTANEQLTYNIGDCWKTIKRLRGDARSAEVAYERVREHCDDRDATIKSLREQLAKAKSGRDAARELTATVLATERGHVATLQGRLSATQRDRAAYKGVVEAAKRFGHGGTCSLEQIARTCERCDYPLTATCLRNLDKALAAHEAGKGWPAEPVAEPEPAKCAMPGCGAPVHTLFEGETICDHCHSTLCERHCDHRDGVVEELAAINAAVEGATDGE